MQDKEIIAELARMAEHIKILNHSSERQSKAYEDLRKMFADSIQGIKTDVSDIKIITIRNASDIDWLKKFFWILVTVTLTSAIASVSNLILK